MNRIKGTMLLILGLNLCVSMPINGLTVQQGKAALALVAVSTVAVVVSAFEHGFRNSRDALMLIRTKLDDEKTRKLIEKCIVDPYKNICNLTSELQSYTAPVAILCENMYDSQWILNFEKLLKENPMGLKEWLMKTMRTNAGFSFGGNEWCEENVNNPEIAYVCSLEPMKRLADSHEVLGACYEEFKMMFPEKEVEEAEVFAKGRTLSRRSAQQ